MSGWESLYHKAAGDYNNGNFKESYNNYLRAANALLYKLSHEVTFANKDAVKSKPNNSARLFQQLKSCVQRLEEILQNRATNGMPSPKLSITSDIATSILTNNPHPTHLPLIPFSPLTRQAISYAHELATISQKVSVATQKSENNGDSLASIRKLNEELRQQRTRLDMVNNQIQSICEVTLLHWDFNAVAQQLTIIDSQLYSKVEFRKDMLSKDRKNSKAQACLDFHRYLTNSFTHQFIIYADTSRPLENQSRSNSHARENIIVQAIRVAYLLLNVHRNFNSFTALVKALTSPEVRRIRRLWLNLPHRMSQNLKELSSFVKKDNDYKVYKDALVQKMSDFRDIGPGMIVIPWMQPHYEEIKTINQSYSSGKSGDSNEVILSQPGALKLESIFTLLERCQGNHASDEGEERGSGRKGSPSTSRIKDPIVIDGSKIPLPLDLSCLGFGDLGLHHWLVSRVFLTKQQLIDESIEIEPLAENEQLPCVDNDCEDEEEEEDDRLSVGQYDIGSDDGNDNMEASTSTAKNDSAIGSTSQTKPNDNSAEYLAKPEFISFSSLIAKAEAEEASSNPTGNSAGVLSFEENTTEPSVKNQTEEFDSIKPESTDMNVGSSSTSSTAAIPIPKSSQRATTPVLSPGSLMAKNLNPLASVFVPRSQSYTNSTSTLVQGAIDKMNAMTKESTEMGEMRKPVNNEDNDDDNQEFVYPGMDDESKSEDDEFVYMPNDIKEEDEVENIEFTYPYQDTNAGKDDDESKTESSSDVDKKDILTKNGESNSSPNLLGSMENVITKVGKSTDNSITVRINSAISKDA